MIKKDIGVRHTQPHGMPGRELSGLHVVLNVVLGEARTVHGLLLRGNRGLQTVGNLTLLALRFRSSFQLQRQLRIFPHNCIDLCILNLYTCSRCFLELEDSSRALRT